MDWPFGVAPLVLQAGVSKLAEDLLGSAVRAAQANAPAVQFGPGVGGTEEHLGRRRQLLDHVPEVEALLYLAKHLAGEVGPKQVAHLGGAVGQQLDLEIG